MSFALAAVLCKLPIKRGFLGVALLLACLHFSAQGFKIRHLLQFSRVLSPHEPETSPARVAFMLECLRSLDADLRDRGGRLILRFSDPIQVLPQLLRDTQAEGIYAHVDFERIYGRVRDARLNRTLAEQTLKIRWFEPSGATADLITTGQYRQRWDDQMSEEIVPTPSCVNVPPDVPGERLPTLSDLGLVDEASRFRRRAQGLHSSCWIAS